MLFLLAALADATPASAYCREVIESPPAGYDPVSQGCFLGNLEAGAAPPLFWRNQCVSFSVQENASNQISLSDAERVAAQAFAVWSAASCPGGGTPGILASAYPAVACDDVPSQGHNNTIIFRDEGWPYEDSANAIGYTTLTVYEQSVDGHVAGEILGADIEGNSANYTIVANGTPPSGAYDLASILTHETGHFLGMAHSADTSAVMYALYHPQSTVLTPDDIAGICSIYPADGSRTTAAGSVAATTCQPAPTLGFQSECGSLDAGQVTAAITASVPCSDSLFGCSVSLTPPSKRAGRTGYGLAELALVVLGAGVLRRRRARRGGVLSVAISVVCFLALGCGSGDDSTASSAGDASTAADATSADASAVEATFAKAASEAAGDQTSGAASADGLADDEGAGGDSSSGDGAGSSSAEGGDGMPTVVIPPVVVSLVRFANWSPDSPAVDVCVAPHGTTAFMGPVVAGLDTAADSAVVGLPFPNASAYVDLSPGQYDARFVVAGATSCATGVGADATALPTLKAGSVTTMALVGEASPSGGDPGLQTVALSDDVSATAVALRFINASPAISPADLGTGKLASSNFVPLFDAVGFGQASKPQDAPDASAGVDMFGYRSSEALSNITLSAHPSGGATDSVSAGGLSAAMGSVLTVTLIGGTSSGIAAQLLVCIDNAGTVGALSNCAPLP